MNHSEFRTVFEQLTDNPPLSWQERLFHDHLVRNDLPRVIDLPTGLGKTMVMAIWLIAWAVNNLLPRRLIYVVDRRTVVDQATDLAEKLVRNWKEKSIFNGVPPAISTLRGQLADNREWSRDLSRPAIIIGTVDLIGSALLFSGYRSSYKRRPLEAGLLGQDSLLVLDEAHLSKPFEKLILAVNDDGSFQKDHDGLRCGNPLRVIRMSATSGMSDNDRPSFTLQFDAKGNLTGDDARDKSTTERFGAKKRLTVNPLGEKEKLVGKLAKAAIELVAPSKPEQRPVVGQRIVVFTRKPDDARSIADAIRRDGEMKNTPGPYAKAVEVLTGTMRGLERDELVEKAVFKERWLNGDLKPDDPANQFPVFLVSTSAGEVGFDLNADHMVCDPAPLDSMIQRLGRVNRRGEGDAIIQVFHEPIKTTDKEGKPKKLEGLEKSIATTLELLNGIDGTAKDVSPKNIAALKDSPTWREKYEDACSPQSAMVELTDILLDAWSMTSITEPMPGRPEVGPWLRGIDKEQTQTTVAWRAELELLRDDPTPEKALRSIFTRHPVRTHESLTVNTGHLLELLKQIPKLKDRPPDLMTTRAAVRLPRGQVVCRTLQQLIDDPGILYADSTLILPATFGGLDAAGMLDSESIPKMQDGDDGELRSLDVADHDGYEHTDAARSRQRILIERSKTGKWTPKPIPGLSIPDDVKLKSDYDKSTLLFNDLKAAGLRVRLVQPIHFDEEGDADRSLVVLAPAPAKKDEETQLLTDHIGAVEAEAGRIADALKLAPDTPVRIALLFAAKWHDEGKKAHVWQVFANNPNPDDQPLGKMAQSRDPNSLRGYRHEFGSLLRIHHTDRCNTAGCVLPDNRDARELALHLIATHHGMGRPHFSDTIYTDFSDTERDAIHADSIRRFARLQRKYGWWHLAWLENLLRCADALASADQDSEDDPTDTGGDEA